jgi:hypothetical protein
MDTGARLSRVASEMPVVSLDLVGFKSSHRRDRDAVHP